MNTKCNDVTRVLLPHAVLYSRIRIYRCGAGTMYGKLTYPTIDAMNLFDTTSGWAGVGLVRSPLTGG